MFFKVWSLECWKLVDCYQFDKFKEINGFYNDYKTCNVDLTGWPLKLDGFFEKNEKNLNCHYQIWHAITS